MENAKIVGAKMMKKKKKGLKIVIIVIAVFMLIWMIGVRLVMWFAVRSITADMEFDTKLFTEYDVTLEGGQTVSHNQVTMSIPDDLEWDTSVEICVTYNNADQERGVLIMDPQDGSEIALFGEKNVAKMSENPLTKIGYKVLRKGFEAMDKELPDSYYTTEKAVLLLTEDDYSFLNWKQGLAYGITAILRDAWMSKSADYYLYETEELGGYMEIHTLKDGTTGAIYVFLFPKDDLDTRYPFAFRGLSLEEVYGCINSIRME